MRWKKLGLVYAPGRTKDWNQLYAILPTPFFLEEQGVLRVFFSSTCIEKYGRMTYLDVEVDNPTKIVSNPEIIALDLGEPGAFDDCGVNPSAVLRTKDGFYLYYAGYQRHQRVPFSILSGLAFSENLKDFKRISNVPILERTTAELNIRSAPSVIFDGEKYRMWYVSGKGWTVVPGDVHKNRLMPTYVLRYGESTDGVEWKVEAAPVFDLRDDEFGFGRPYIFYSSGKYYLFYSVRRQTRSYRIGYAISSDGKNWERRDQDIGIDVSGSGWDSEMICYPAVISVNGRTFMFYNGNNNGETGFGVAELIAD